MKPKTTQVDIDTHFDRHVPFHRLPDCERIQQAANALGLTISRFDAWRVWRAFSLRRQSPWAIVSASSLPLKRQVAQAIDAFFERPDDTEPEPPGDGPNKFQVPACYHAQAKAFLAADLVRMITRAAAESDRNAAGALAFWLRRGISLPDFDFEPGSKEAIQGAVATLESTLGPVDAIARRHQIMVVAMIRDRLGLEENPRTAHVVTVLHRTRPSPCAYAVALVLRGVARGDLVPTSTLPSECWPEGTGPNSIDVSGITLEIVADDQTTLRVVSARRKGTPTIKPEHWALWGPQPTEFLSTGEVDALHEVLALPASPTVAEDEPAA